MRSSFTSKKSATSNCSGTETRAKNVLGLRFWLTTPIDGVRLGLGGKHSKQSNLPPPAPPTTKETNKDWLASLDANFEYFLLQAEYLDSKREGTSVENYYILAGLKLLDNKIGVNFQYQKANLDMTNVVSDVDLGESHGFGLRYSFRPDLVAKAEYHIMKTIATDDPVGSPFLPPNDVDYYIISLSASF